MQSWRWWRRRVSRCSVILEIEKISCYALKLAGVLAIDHEWPTLRMTTLNFERSLFPRDSYLHKTSYIFCNCSHVLLLGGWCTLGCTTFLVPVHSSCTIHRIRKYISKEWSFNLGQNNLLMIGVNHLSQIANKFHLHFRYTCRKEIFKAKDTTRPRVKVYLFWELLGPPLHIWGGKKYIEKDSMSKYSHVFKIKK
jgi:hypothetical protein